MLPTELPKTKREWVRTGLSATFTAIFVFAGLSLFGGKLPNTSWAALAFLSVVGGAGFLTGLVVTSWLFRKQK